MSKQRIWFIGLALLTGILVFVFMGDQENDRGLMNEHQTFEVFYVEEKDHHIEPGGYIEMWVVGYNEAEKEENREYFKVYIKDGNVYNLIEKDKSYLFSFSSKSEPGRYYLDQKSPPNGTQLRGEGS